MGVVEHSLNQGIPHRTIYWQGINIDDWRFFIKFPNIKIANINM